MGLNLLPSKLTRKRTCFIEETSTQKDLITVRHQTRHHHALHETKTRWIPMESGVSRHNKFQHRVGLNVLGNRDEQKTLRVQETTLHSQRGKPL